MKEEYLLNRVVELMLYCDKIGLKWSNVLLNAECMYDAAKEEQA
jgi:hypothetical protein